jgi:hypothetical protein
MRSSQLNPLETGREFGGGRLELSTYAAVFMFIQTVRSVAATVAKFAHRRLPVRNVAKQRHRGIKGQMSCFHDIGAFLC